MNYRSLIYSLTVCLTLLFCLSGVPCQNVFAQENVEPVDDVEDTEFVYNPAGRRDPFASLIQKIRKTVVAPRVNLGPLGKYELGQLRLMAMLVVQGTPRAMVRAPDGKSYTVKLGDLVGPNGGVVTRIETKQIDIDKMTGQRVVKSPDRIVVEETGLDNITGKIFKEERYIEM